jgi:DNA-binding response OmpR family regulator
MMDKLLRIVYYPGMATSDIRVLIAEDDLALAEIYGTRLEASGITVLHCRDGQEVVDKLKEFNPNLILLDLMMPNLSGFAVIEKVRAMADITQPKILVLTALNEPEDKDRALKLGANEYLMKSGVALEEVLAIVHRALGIQEGTAAQS